MGIFKDFATSPLGDFTIGALSEFEDRAARDVVVNATASQNSLDKETKAFNEYETAFKNKSEISNILAANPDAFGLSMQEGLDINQVADRFTNFMFKQNRSIFEGTDMDKVKLNVAKFMAQNPGQGFTIYDPYIAGEDRFKREQELHQARISAITKTPRADKLLMKIEKAEAGVATPESITDELTKVAALTAKGYGILNTFPTSEAGQKNLQFVQVNLITANAKAQFPDDKEARAQFINQKLFDNNINPADGIMYSSNINFKLMSNVIAAEGSAVAQKMLELTNQIAAAPDDETRKLLNDQRDQLVLEQHKIMDTYTKTAGTLMAGPNRQDLFPAEGQTITTPKVVDGYVPTVNNEGEVVILIDNGTDKPTEQKLDLEMLVDFYTDSPENFKKLPIQVQNYVSDIADNLFVDGQMIEPKRNMFEEGRAGDKAFEDFTRIYNIFFPDTSDRIFDEVETLEPTKKTKLQKDDITKLKKDKRTGNEIKTEELLPANTIVPKKKPDQPEEPKEKSLQEKIKEDFPNVNVGTSAGAEFGLSASKDMDFKNTMRKSESSDNYMVVNKEGYMGAFQFGDARLQDYKTANKEEFTNQEFLNNKDLQEKVFDWHVGDIVKYIQDNNLDEAIGKKVNGVVITLNGLVAAAHLGGKFGMRQYVESGFDKKFNKEDSNGTSLFDYIQRFQLTK